MCKKNLASLATALWLVVGGQSAVAQDLSVQSAGCGAANCFPMEVTTLYGKRLSNYDYDLKVQLTVPTSVDKAVLWAYSEKDPAKVFVNKAGAWVPYQQCGGTVQAIIEACATPSGTHLTLSQGLSNRQLGEMGVLVKYLAIKNGNVAEEGFAFQCLLFGNSLPLCFSFGRNGIV